MRRFISLIVSFLILIHCQVVFAEDLTLILDVKDSNALPDKFRTTQDTIYRFSINKKGLRELNIAGGAQFSASQFMRLVGYLKTKDMTVIDLREESHGFLNKHVVSWYGNRDAPNINKAPEVIALEEKTLIQKLGASRFAQVAEVLQKENEEITAANVYRYRVQEVLSESALVERNGARYKRIYVTDHHVPKPSEVDRYIALAKTLPLNKWVYYHCEHGRGRTTTFMVMHDSLFNAKKVSLRDILIRQDVIGGKNFLPFLEAKSLSERQAKKIRFIKLFYQYAKENQDRYATSFSMWLKQQGLKYQY